MKDLSSSIVLETKPADPSRGSGFKVLRTFSSYQFERNMLVPASPFRFTAEGVDKTLRKAIRSSDTVELFVNTPSGQTVQLATGFIDETDTHTTGLRNEYLLSGRDTLGQLVDNAAVDSSDQIVHFQDISLANIARQLVKNTRIPSQVVDQHSPNGGLKFQTNPGETKINALQRYMEYCNCLVWSNPAGQLVIGKPNFSKRSQGNLTLRYTDSSKNNMLECRSRRNTNQAVRRIATQIQSLETVDTSPYTLINADADVRAVSGTRAGRSVYRLYSPGNGMDAVNAIEQVGNSGPLSEIGFQYSKRELARENMHVLEIECVVKGHVNESGIPYNIDQIYHVVYEDDDVEEDMYVYYVKYDLTPDRGRLTTMRLVRLGTIVADVNFTQARKA